ncbi:MAG: DUF1622 domain-containing protein [Bacteroidota bacterium]
MEEIIKTGINILAKIVELFAAMIIGYASIKVFLFYCRDVVFSKTNSQPGPSLRITLGKSLAIALELLLGADILRTAISPTWSDIGQLAAIAVIRTALNYFLERDIKMESS